MYAFVSAANNNGSAFAGLSANTDFYNIALGLVMLVGRFVPIVLVLALAGSLPASRPSPSTAGTLPTHRPLFVVMLVGVVDHRRRPDLLPGARARPDRRGTVMMPQQTSSRTAHPTKDPARDHATPPAAVRVQAGLLDPEMLLHRAARRRCASSTRG